MIASMSSAPVWLGSVREVPNTFLGIAALFGVPILLLIYAARHGAKRRKELGMLMPTLGLRPIAKPLPSELIPEQLFHPNGFEDSDMADGGSEDGDAKDGGWKDPLSRVPVAWSGQLGPHSVIVMEVSVKRLAYVADMQEDSKNIQHELTQTVLRCVPTGEDRPPELLIKEHMWFKSQVKGARTVGGSSQIGAHYFVFSNAPRDELERWLPPRLRDLLSRHRLWQIAVHQGVLYLTRGGSYERPNQIKSFLGVGEALLSEFLVSR